MKKLMIAAVAVAMAGVASAKTYDTMYRFTATLKTTKGKSGTSYYSKYYYLGRDAAEKMWYSDATAAKLITDGIIVKGDTSKGEYPMMLNTDPKTGLVIVPEKDRAEVEGILIALSETYKYPSMGRYCSKFRTYTAEECYRVVGSERIDELLSGNCCSKPVGFTGLGSQIVINKSDADTQLIHLFGAQDAAKCNKIEMFAWAQFPVRDFKGYIAGQGAGKKSLIGDDFDLTSLAGNIVGSMAAPVCKDCCTVLEALPDALAWDCAGTARKLKDVKIGEQTFEAKKYDSEETTLSRTAAFGNFRMKKTLVERN